MVTLVSLLVLGVGMVGAATIIVLVARAVSYGERPGRVEGSIPLYGRPVRVNHDDRRFGPSLYELDVWPGTLGISCSHHLLTPVLARLFYPHWWFNIGDAEMSTSKSKVLWQRAPAESIVIRYRRDGKEHSIEVVPEEITVLLERLGQAGFSTRSGSAR